MKKTLLLLCCLFSIACAQASHLMGGNMTATHTTGSSYNLRLTYYRDTLGVPMYLTEPMYIYALNAATGSYSLVTSLTVNHNIPLSTSLLSSFPYGVEVGVFDTTISLAAGQYRILTYECCRNCAIINATTPCTEYITLYTDLTVTPTNNNSTPDFLNMPIGHFPVNAITTYNPLPYDVDGDSVAWALNTPAGGSYNGGTGSALPPVTPVAGFTTPPANTGGPFTMNPVTGEVSWSPSMVGNFIQSFIVKEYRNGVQIGTVIRDMQYVVDAIPLYSSFVAVTPYNTNTQAGYHYIYYTPGQPLVFKITGASQSTVADLSMTCSGALFMQPAPPVFSMAAAAGSSITGTLAWTPPAGMTADQIVAFRLEDGVHANDFTLLMRRAPAPSAVSAVASGITSFQAYPNPASGHIAMQLELARDIEGEIVLCNTMGQPVKTMYSGRLHQGKSLLTDDVTAAAGQYFIKVISAGKVLHTTPVTIQ